MELLIIGLVIFSLLVALTNPMFWFILIGGFIAWLALKDQDKK